MNAKNIVVVMKMEKKNQSNMKEQMKKDSMDRNRILEEVERNLDEHTRKMVEYDQKAKHLDLLEVKYNSLERESKATITAFNQKLQTLTEENENLENEVMILKRTIVNFKSKITGLRSVVELMINDFGIDQVALATGLEKDKLKEYLKD